MSASTTKTHRLLAKREVAVMLGCTTRTVERLVAAKKIPFTYLPNGLGNGRRVRFPEQAINRWIKGCSTIPKVAVAEAC